MYLLERSCLDRLVIITQSVEIDLYHDTRACWVACLVRGPIRLQRLWILCNAASGSVCEVVLVEAQHAREIPVLCSRERQIAALVSPTTRWPEKRRRTLCRTAPRTQFLAPCTGEILCAVSSCTVLYAYQIRMRTILLTTQNQRL